MSNVNVNLLHYFPLYRSFQRNDISFLYNFLLFLLAVCLTSVHLLIKLLFTTIKAKCSSMKSTLHLSMYSDANLHSYVLNITIQPTLPYRLPVCCDKECFVINQRPDILIYINSQNISDAQQKGKTAIVELEISVHTLICDVPR